MSDTTESTTCSEVRKGAYYDSVVLMQLQKALTEQPGVLDAGVVMATPANLDLLVSSHLKPSETAGSDDLLIVVKAMDEPAAMQALGRVDELLKRRRSMSQTGFLPRSLAAAARQLPAANWVLVSVAGRYAANVARGALDLDLNVFLYSDNVAMEDEVDLKQRAQRKGLLVMGPDCGTAIINGIGFGFANRVRRGPIGLVAASGTGLQAIASAIHNKGSGLTQAIGTGGRDLKRGVDAVTTRQGLALLADDTDTKVIVLVSKPPEPEIASQVLATAMSTNKPVVVYFIGFPPPADRLGNLYFTSSLESSARLAVEINNEIGMSTYSKRVASGERIKGFLRGLFSGGTLAFEAIQAVQLFLDPLHSNVAFHGVSALNDVLVSEGHTIIDMGEDDFTQGRLHPMMDNDLRIRRLRQEAADPQTGAILLDVVLGEGSHPDPASELAPVIATVQKKAREEKRSLTVVAVVVGTDEDPQDRQLQTKRLQDAGAVVFGDTIEAVNFLNSKMVPEGSVQPAGKASDALKAPVAAINVGLELFYDSLTSQGAAVLQVDWRPPAGGNEKMMALLTRLKAQ